MTKKGNIGFFEGFSLAAMMMVTRLFYLGPADVIKKTGTAAWYSALISTAVAIINFLIIYALIKKFRGKEFSEIILSVLGNAGGRIVAVLFILYGLLYSAAGLREGSELVKASSYQDTPAMLISIAFIVTAGIVCVHGVEGLSKISAIYFFPVVGGVLLMLILNFGNYDINWLFPAQGYGIDKTIYYGVLKSASYTDVFILATIADGFRENKDIKKAGIYAILVAGVTFSFVVMCTIMTYDYSLAQESLSCFLEVVKHIFFGRFFQRLESVFIFAMVSCSVISIAAGIFMGINIFCRSFSVGKYKLMIAPFCVIAFSLSVLPRDLTQLLKYYLIPIRQYSTLLIVLVPAVLLIISSLKDRREGKQN